METNVGSGLEGVAMQCLVASLPTLDAPLNDGPDKASAPAKDGEFAFVQVCALGVTSLLCSAPMGTESAFEEMLPSNGILLCNGGGNGGVK